MLSLILHLGHIAVAIAFSVGNKIDNIFSSSCSHIHYFGAFHGGNDGGWESEAFPKD